MSRFKSAFAFLLKRGCGGDVAGDDVEQRLETCQIGVAETGEGRGLVDRCRLADSIEHRRGGGRQIDAIAAAILRILDRKRVVKGTSVTIRVDLGGGRCIKKKTHR